MNKLELEMHENGLKRSREFCEYAVKMDKQSIWLNRLLVGLCTSVAVWVFVIGVGYLRDRNWIGAILEFLLALPNVGFGVNAIVRNNTIKQSLKHHKGELERIDFEIELLHE